MVDARSGKAKMTVLKTAHLTLRPCRPEDAAEFIELERDPEVMRFLNGGAVDHETIGPGANFLMPRGTEPHVWTAFRTSNGAFVGWFCLWPESETVAELGYRLRRQDWGRGLGSEGASALVDWGFRQAGYDTIVATTMAVNLASRRVMEKIGMIHTRTDFAAWADPIPGSEQGEVWYELRRPSTGNASCPLR
jgi:RimJ/RimL family protein N-acetyltransferase